VFLKRSTGFRFREVFTAGHTVPEVIRVMMFMNSHLGVSFLVKRKEEEEANSA
jgi:hypothetical protein